MNSYDIFIAVVEHKNFSAAAKKLHRSPSAISKHISALENRLSVQLVDRSTRSLSITEAGQQYYLRCLDISQRMAQAEDELKDVSNEPSGKLKLTWPVLVSYSSIAQTLSDFSVRYPLIDIELDVNINIKSLIDHNLDFAFRVGKLNDSRLIAIPLMTFVPILCASPSAIERWGSPNTVEELQDFPMISQSNINNSQKAREVLSPFQKLPFADSYGVNDIVTMLQLAKRGMGAAVLFRHMIEKELQEGSLVNLLPSMSMPRLPVHLVYQRMDYMPKRLRVFVDFFKNSFS